MSNKAVKVQASTVKSEKLNHCYSVSTLCASTNSFRDTGDFCDVVLKIESNEYPAHKVILSAFSPFFKAMFLGEFAESHQPTISLKNIDFSIVDDLLDYIYTAQIKITESNVGSLINAAHFLQADSLFEMCCRFLESNLKAENCLGLWSLAEVYMCSTLQVMAKEYTLTNFSDVSKELEFLQLEKEKVIDLINEESLRVPTEDVVLDAVLRWLLFKEEERKEIFHEVLRQVRLIYVRPIFLFDRIFEVGSLWKCNECVLLLKEAKNLMLGKSRCVELRSAISRIYTNSDVEVMQVHYETNIKQNVTRVVLTDDGRVVRGIDLPQAKEELVTVVSNHKILVHAYDNSSIWTYDSDKNRFKQTSPLTRKRYEIGFIVLENQWYAVGGSVGFISSFVDRYDAVKDVWTESASLPESVFLPLMVTHNRKLYVFDVISENNYSYVYLVQGYDPRLNEWTRLVSFPSELINPKLCVLDGKIYAFCTETNQKDVYVYDIANNERSDCPHLRYDFAAGPVVLNGRIFVISHKTDDIKVIERLLPGSPDWDELQAFESHKL